jgi:hypothetical protein
MVAFQWGTPCSIWIHGLRVMEFWRFQPCFGHALSHCQCNKLCPKLSKFAKICLKTKLWNTIKNQDFRFSQKQKFVHVEEALEHVSTIRIFNPRIYHMLFLLSKDGLCMWISAIPPCGNKLIVTGHCRNNYFRHCTWFIENCEHIHFGW